jgi:hypothetical protein
MACVVRTIPDPSYLMMPSFLMLFTAKFTEKSASLVAFFGSTVWLRPIQINLSSDRVDLLRRVVNRIVRRTPIAPVAVEIRSGRRHLGRHADKPHDDGAVEMVGFEMLAHRLEALELRVRNDLVRRHTTRDARGELVLDHASHAGILRHEDCQRMCQRIGRCSGLLPCGDKLRRIRTGTQKARGGHE